MCRRVTHRAVVSGKAYNTQIGSLTGGGTVGGNVILGAATLTVGGDNTSPAAFAGAISGTGGSLTKIGSGILTLTGANTYSGHTTVSAGTLLVNNTTGSGTGTGPVLVGLGATLGGSGRISGQVTIQNGGILAPGNSPGTLSISNSLTLSSGTISNFELQSSAIYDRVISITNMTFGGTLNVVSYAGGPTFAAGQVYDLFDFSGTSAGNFSSITLPPLPTTLKWHEYLPGVKFDYTSGQIQVDAAAVAELAALESPSTNAATNTYIDQVINSSLPPNHHNPYWTPKTATANSTSGEIEFTGLDVGSDAYVLLWLDNTTDLPALPSGERLLTANSTGADLTTFHIWAPFVDYNAVLEIPTTGSTAYLAYDFVGYSNHLNAFALVPEPGSLAILGLGLAGLLMQRRRSTQPYSVYQPHDSAR